MQLQTIAGRIILCSAASACALVPVACGSVTPAPAAFATAAPAAAATEGVAVLVVLPENDDVLAGVRLGASEAERAAGLMRVPFSLHVLTATDAAAAAAAAAEWLVHNRAHVLIGGADAAAARALRDVAVRENVLFINAGSDDVSLREHCSRLTFHIPPDQAMQRDALALAAAPAGADVVAWHATLERFGAGQVSDRFHDRFGRPMTGRAWSGWMALKVAWEAGVRAAAGDAAALARFLKRDDVIFDGHKGIPLSFRPRSHQLRQTVYVIAGDSLYAEVPSLREDRDIDPAELLDRLGNLTGGEPCAAS